MPRFSLFTRRRVAALALVVTATAGLLVVNARTGRVSEPPNGPAMSDASMREWLDNWYGAHPAHGAMPLAAAAPPSADTVLVSNFRFDSDGSSATVIDTVKILAGQSVLFKHVGGFHTTTSGNPGDLSAGSVWDLPVEPGVPESQVEFPTVGTFPYHCRPHGAFFNMKGVILVKPNTAGVAPSANAAGVGFVVPAWPNPSKAGASFRFRVDQAGSVRLRMLDTSGRAIARVLDDRLEPGVHEAAWNARRADGARVEAGTYWALLEVHGARYSTKVVISR